MPENPIGRREFVLRSVGTLGAIAAGAALPRSALGAAAGESPVRDGVYSGDRLDQIAFPMGGIGAGMVCLEGAGALTDVSIRNRPAVQNQPGFFAAISILGPAKVARVVEGPVPKWKLFERRHAAKGDAPI